MVHNEEIDFEALHKSYTDPLKAARFVSQTGVDIMAAVFGNVHGVFPTQPDLDLDLLARIRKSLPNTFLSLHGGSGISELRQEYKDALSEKMAENPDEYAMYKLVPDVILAVAAVVEAKIEVFGSAGRV